MCLGHRFSPPFPQALKPGERTGCPGTVQPTAERCQTSAFDGVLVTWTIRAGKAVIAHNVTEKPDRSPPLSTTDAAAEAGDDPDVMLVRQDVKFLVAKARIVAAVHRLPPGLLPKAAAVAARSRFSGSEAYVEAARREVTERLDRLQRQLQALASESSELPVPRTGILATHFVVAADIDTTASFYIEVLGGEVVWRGGRHGGPTYVKIANIWIGIDVRGGPTPDVPQVFLDDSNRFDTFLNLRVADIQAVYDEWRGRGASFLTPPLDNQGYELRCYLRDPDGRIIEVGQATGFLEDLGGLNSSEDDQ